MQISCFLLLCIQVMTSSLISDVSSRGLGLIRYAVFPTDPANDAQIAQTETLLEDMQSDAAVIPKRSSDGTTIWFVKSTNADLNDVISALKGVSFVEKETSSELIRRDILKYLASAKELSIIKETEEFLNSKVQAGTEYRRILDDDGTTVLGWGGLVLDEEAAKVVEEYEGIEYPLMVGEVGKDRVLPSALSTRAGKWTKKTNADKAPVMDSQYK